MWILQGYTLFLDAFYANAKKYANKPAVYDEESVLTYEQLSNVTDLVAEKMLSLGAKKGECVLVYVPRCKEVLVGAIGAFKAGLVYVPADASYPVERLNYMKDDSRAVCVCTTKKQWEQKPLDISLDRVIFLDEIDFTESLKPETVFPVISPNDDAFVIYTSGSTGRPKGVLHTHLSLFSLVNWQPDTEKRLGTTSRFVNLASFSFIASITDLFSPLLSGGSTFIVSNETRQNLQQLYTLLCQKNITNILAPVRLAVLLLENYDMRQFDVRMGGERVVPFHPLYPTTITELYGSSEGCFSVIGVITGLEDPMPLGMPNECIDYQILNDALEPVSQGQVGEFTYCGPILAKGYLNLPEQTAEKWFVRDGKRWFRTGDLVREDANGLLYYIQRKDFMIKLRGFRIEPGEVESQVVRVSSGKISSAVCVLKEVSGEDRLCCYFEAKEKVNVAALKNKLKEVLADYLVPEILIQLDELPKNPNGKLDRKALPQPEEPEEEVLTSLGIMRLAADAYEKFGISIPFEELYRAGTLKNMLALIEARKETYAKVSDSEDMIETQEVVPLCFSQIGVYADCIARPNSLMYNLPVLIKMPQNTKCEVLEKALLDILNSHPYLNVRFETTKDGKPIQRIYLQPDDFHISYKQLSEESLSLVKRSNIRPFKLDGSEPLYRLEILETESALYLFADFHHLIFDGSSFFCFCKELHTLLNGGVIRAEKFSGFQLAAQQLALWNSPSFADIHNFWQSRHSLVESATEILPDLINTSETAGNEVRLSMKIDPRSVRGMAKRSGTNASSVYLAALLYTLAAYTGEDAIGIVTISNGRRNVKLANSFGMFVNTLPITALIPSEGSVAEFVKNIQKIFDEAILNESYPFAELAKEFNFRPNIMFAYQVDILSDIGKDDFIIENLEQGNAKFPLYFSVTGQGNEISLELRYDEDKYSRDFMQQILQTYSHCVQQFCVRDTLESIAFCDEKQLAILDSFNPKLESFTETETIVSMFRKMAQTYPDNLAVVFKDTAITYGQLDDETDKLARYIKANIVGKNITSHEPTVSILVRRGPNMVVCALAVLKAGCAYQPLDPSYPTERIAYMISDAEPVMLIADSDCLHLATSYNGEILKTEEIPNLPDVEEDIQVSIRPKNLFILLYTSGSTGKPKGVMLEHQNLTAFCRWYRRYYGLKPEHRVAGYASFGFDACMMDLYPALTTGACIHIIPEEMRLDLNAINSYFEKNGITHSFMTTQVGVQFHQTQENHSLLHLSVGGEKLVSVKPGETYTLHNGYGPTECTIFTTTTPVLKQEANIPIGRPVDALHCAIVDKKLRRLPIGAVGELVIYGAQVGRGYLNLPERTSEVFYTQNGMRAYHTGDFVRYRMNGNIEFVCRKDGQVKIRGFRVELKEIETVIREFEGITEVTVQVFDAPQGGKFLAAYIVCDDSLQINDLKSYILANKPAYMLPASINRIPFIPLNINQKVDRKALPVPVFSSEENFVEPETDKERIVASAIAHVTGVQGRISAFDGFAELGGDSISALRLSTELQREHLQITPNLILRLDTVREIAKAAMVIKSPDNECVKHFSGHIENSAIVQYFYDLNLPKPEHFNQAMFYKAASPIDMKLLSQSFGAIVQRHDVLRAVSHDNHLLVRKATEGALFTLTEDIVDNIKDKIDTLQRSFDLEKGPLVHACVFHAEHSDYLFIVMHHLIVDGVSWRIFTEDLNRAYQALVSGEEVRFSAMTDSYADYVEAQNRYRKSMALLSQKPYWDEVRRRLSDLPCTDRDRGLPTFEQLSLHISPKLTQDLLMHCNIVYKNKVNDLFLTAVGKSFYMLTGETSVSVRLEGHGREVFDPNLSIDRTIGWFTSIYPVVLENLDKKLPDVIRETKEMLRRIPKNGLGYGSLYGIETDKMPLLTFNYLGRMSENTSGGMFTLSEDYDTGDSIAPENHYGTDINFNGLLIGDGITFFVDYNCLCYNRTQMQTLADGFVQALEHIVTHLKFVNMPNLTANDFGEYEWTVAEFDFIVKDFAERGERILAIYPMSKAKKRILNKAISSADGRPGLIRVPIQINGIFTREMFFEALKELYDLHEDLRFAVAFYGVSKPRVVLTDRKSVMQYFDVSLDEDPYLKLTEIRGDLNWFFIDLQLHPLMQLTVVKTAENEHYLLFSFHKILYDIHFASERVDDYLRLLATKTTGATDISEWRDLIRIGEIVSHSPSTNGNVSVKTSARSLKDEFEVVVAEKFEILLDVDAETLTSESDFFELGGDKFMSVKLSDLLLESFGYFIPPVTLCEHSTIHEIAAMIESGDCSEVNEDIHIYSSHSDKKPLVFVHTANTGSEVYYKLAKHLENEFSFSVLEQYNINHLGTPKEDIPSLATKYIEILKRIQPHGPYNLGGWCFGGTVAYEMARQLTLAGEKVEKLILLDSHIIETEELRKKLIDSSKAHSREYLSTAPLFEGMRQKGLLERYIANSVRASRMWLEYNPPRYDGSVLYVKACVKANGLMDASDEMYDTILKQKAAGFEKRVPVGNLKIIEVKKDHDSLMDDDALQIIVPAMKDYLNE